MNGTTIYFRGFRILKQTLHSLLERGMKDATEVVLTGCSGKCKNIIQGTSTYLVGHIGVRYYFV